MQMWQPVISMDYSPRVSTKFHATTGQPTTSITPVAAKSLLAHSMPPQEQPTTCTNPLQPICLILWPPPPAPVLTAAHSMPPKDQYWPRFTTLLQCHNQLLAPLQLHLSHIHSSPFAQYYGLHHQPQCLPQLISCHRHVYHSSFHATEGTNISHASSRCSNVKSGTAAFMEATKANSGNSAFLKDTSMDGKQK